jgi:hypothetical protein
MAISTGLTFNAIKLYKEENYRSDLIVKFQLINWHKRVGELNDTLILVRQQYLIIILLTGWAQGLHKFDYW